MFIEISKLIATVFAYGLGIVVSFGTCMALVIMNVK